MKITRIDPLNPDVWNERLKNFEHQFSYPLGTDRFSLDHGEDYFAFFNRLGRVHCYVIHEGDEILGLGQGILRTLPSGEKAWYLCDLKVTPKARGRKLTYQLFKRTFFPNYFKAPRGYAVTMDPAHGVNPIVKLATQLPWTPLKVATKLSFFTLTATQMLQHKRLIERQRGPVSFLSHQGRKDLILASTGRALPLWHVQFGPLAESQTTEVADGIFMLCSPENDPLTKALIQAGLTASASAHVLHHRLAHTNWAFILTSDI